MKKWFALLLAQLILLASFGTPVAFGKSDSAPAAARDFHVEDYGAIGDGVHDDGPALTQAVNAALAVPTGAVKVILQPGKTYRIETERTDSWPYFTLENAKNFTFDGNGSTLLMARPVNSFFGIDYSKNIKIQNVVLDYDELPYTQGTIVAIDKANGTFDVNFDDGYPLPTLKSNGPWPTNDFGVLYDPVEPHPKFASSRAYSLISGASDLGNRTFRITLQPAYKADLNYYAVNDRYIVKLRFNHNLSNELSKTGSINGIGLLRSKNVQLTGITIYSSLYMGIQAAECEGELLIDGLKEIRKPGTNRLASTTADGIHFNSSRTGPVVTNSIVENTLDDILNNAGGVYKINAIHAPNDLSGNFGDHIRVHDSLQFYNFANGSYIGTANVTEVPTQGRVVLDQPVLQGVTDNELSNIYVLNLSASGNGFIIKNNTFQNGVRFAILARAHGGLIENNVIQNNESSAMYLNPQFVGFQEGPVSSDITIRGNTITGNRGTPIVANTLALSKPSRVLSNIVLDHNVIAPRTTGAISLSAIQGLTMTDNQIDMSAVPNTVRDSAVTITNSAAIAIDGLSIKDPRTSVAQALLITDSNLDGMVLRNLQTDLADTMEPYTILKETPDVVLDDFEQGTEGWTGVDPYMAAQVSTMPNPPQKAYHGQYLLQWKPTSIPAPANVWRTVYKEYATPLDLSATPIFRAAFNSQGYAGSGLQYQVKLEFTSGSDTFSQTIPAQAGGWSTISADLSGWAHANAIDKISISFRIANLDVNWLGSHQIDYVGADRKPF